MISNYSPDEKSKLVMESFTDNVALVEISKIHGSYTIQLSKGRKHSIREGKSTLIKRRIQTPETRRSRTSRRSLAN